ncbi:MAG: hypothetical protein R3C03_24105 [Pirellulaceae bacterium]
MRSSTDKIENYRILSGRFATTPRSGLTGAYWIPVRGKTFLVIASDGSDWDNLPGKPWEHVSVSSTDRTPSWAEMDFIKNLFWSSSETVIQFHPAKGEKINIHENCLHLWKPTGFEIQLPPTICV